MFYNYYKPSESEFNDCISKGACSVPPSVSAFKEVIVMLLRQLAYYIQKLNKLGVDCDELKLQLVHSLADILTNTEYSDEEVYTSIIGNYNNLIQTKEFYSQICKDKGISARDLRSEIKISSDMNLAELMSLGEKIYKMRSRKFPNSHKQLFEILLLVTQNLSSNISLIEDYTDVEVSYLDGVVFALNILNFYRTSVLKLKKYISDIVSLNSQLVSKLGDEIYTKFGKISEVKVSLSSRPNKAILVSGTNLNDLYELLKQTKDENIDIYTHSDLLIAHALEKFSEFPQLYGHYGTSTDNFMLDFATFPGAILLTKCAVKNLEYLYRGRLFSTDRIVPVGVSTVSANDFGGVVGAAKKSKGFKTGREKGFVTVGYSENIFERLKKIADDFNSKAVKNLIVIGMTSINTINNDFYNEFISQIPDDTFVISFGAENQGNNILSINLSNNVPLLYRFMNMFLEMLEPEYDRVTFFISKCDANSFSAMIALRDNGFKNIYLSNCPPNAINPQTLNAFAKLYGIRLATNPKDDLKSIISK